MWWYLQELVKWPHASLRFSGIGCCAHHIGIETEQRPASRHHFPRCKLSPDKNSRIRQTEVFKWLRYGAVPNFRYNKRTRVASTAIFWTKRVTRFWENCEGCHEPFIRFIVFWVRPYMKIDWLRTISCAGNTAWVCFQQGWTPRFWAQLSNLPVFLSEAEWGHLWHQIRGSKSPGSFMTSNLFHDFRKPNGSIGDLWGHKGSYWNVIDRHGTCLDVWCAWCVWYFEIEGVGIPGRLQQLWLTHNSVVVRA